MAKSQLEVPNVQPSATYGDPNTPVCLRIATGGAGRSGILQALVEGFLQSSGINGSVEWYASDTTWTFTYLRNKIVDIGITYHAIAELIALKEGIIDRIEYAWRDHWLLVGPASNPACLDSNGQPNIYRTFATLGAAMENTRDTEAAIRFLSRSDRSACNIKESALFSTIGLTPWVSPISAWYHMAGQPPFEALESAAALGEYSLTDRGTWFAIGLTVRERMKVYAFGGDDEDDALLNPAHLVKSANADHKIVASQFTDWIIKDSGGQEIIENFKQNDLVLYTAAPKGVDPVGRAKRSMGV